MISHGRRMTTVSAKSSINVSATIFCLKLLTAGSYGLGGPPKNEHHLPIGDMLRPPQVSGQEDFLV